MAGREEEDPDVRRLVVVFLRFFADMTQADFGKASGVNQGLVSRYETPGRPAPPEESQRRMAAAVGVPWPLVMHLRRFYSVILRTIAREKGEAADVEAVEAFLDKILLSLAAHLIEMSWPEEWLYPEEELDEAEEIWTNLRELPMGRRWRLVDLAQGAYPQWALAERICEASLEALTGQPDEALELADLALFVAEQVPDERWRSRVEGYCWAHIANARRAAGDSTGADEAFALAWELWKAGAGSDPGGLLPESRLRDLEAGRPPEQ